MKLVRMCSWGKTKYQYQHQKTLSIKIVLNSYYFNDCYFNYSLISLETGIFTEVHCKQAKQIILSTMYDRYFCFLKIKTNFPKTKKTAGFRMGRGKGYFNKLIFLQKKGQLLYQFNNFFRSITFIKQLKAGLPTKIFCLGYTSFFVRKNFKLFKIGGGNYGSNF